MIPQSNNPQTLFVDGIVINIDASTTQANTFNIIDGSSLELTGVVPSTDTISLSTPYAASSDNYAKLIIGDTPDFQGSITFDNSLVVLDGLVPGGGTNVRSWDLSNGVMSFYAQGTRVAHFNFTDVSPNAGKGGNIQVAQLGSDFYITEGGQHQPDGATLLNSGVIAPPVTQPPAPQIVAVHDNTAGADVSDTSSAYTGPVAGLISQFINFTPDNLNIMAMADGLFIKTGAGNDGIVLHGGTNVVDAGGGSNFLTSGGGFDTFFLDARNIPAASSAAGPVPGAIWDTIQSFGHGDAATFWGVGPGTALVWQKNEGAVGHTGLTLHANMSNGSEASLTLAGIDSKAGLSLSYGSSGGSSYLYVKAV